MHPGMKSKWLPGQSGNPGGRPRMPDELRAITSLSRIEILKLVSKYARMSMDELQEAGKSRSTPLVELSIASIFLHTVKNGDYARLAFLLEQALGKVPTSAITDEEAQARKELQELSDSELLKLVKEKIPEFEDVSRGTK